jgi:uncharacterized BrkB/YihY/UPF0761 family membrane protein
MKTTDKIMLYVIAITAVAIGALYWWRPDMHWGVYVVVGVVFAAVGLEKTTKDVANIKQANAGDAARKP